MLLLQVPVRALNGPREDVVFLKKKETPLQIRPVSAPLPQTFSANVKISLDGSSVLCSPDGYDYHFNGYTVKVREAEQESYSLLELDV